MKNSKNKQLIEEILKKTGTKEPVYLKYLQEMHENDFKATDNIALETLKFRHDKIYKEIFPYLEWEDIYDYSKDFFLSSKYDFEVQDLKKSLKNNLHLFEEYSIKGYYFYRKLKEEMPRENWHEEDENVFFQYTKKPEIIKKIIKTVQYTIPKSLLLDEISIKNMEIGTGNLLGWFFSTISEKEVLDKIGSTSVLAENTTNRCENLTLTFYNYQDEARLESLIEYLPEMFKTMCSLQELSQASFLANKKMMITLLDKKYLELNLNEESSACLIRKVKI